LGFSVPDRNDLAVTSAVCTPAARCPEVAGFTAAPLSVFRSLASTVVDVYVVHDPSSGPMLYCQAGWALDRARLDELVNNDVAHLLVKDGDFAAFSNSLLTSLESTLRRAAVPPTERFAALQMAVAAEIERTLQVADCSQYCEAAKTISQQLVTLLSENDVLPQDLFRLARHDFKTFMHVTNVTSYSVMLADRLGISDPDERREIAYGAMLHDIGKRHVPAHILTKPGRLTNDERSTIESHPTNGYRELRQRKDLSFGQLMMVYQHHERVDGTGYPVGVLVDEIHLWARLVAVVDVFDALTAVRPYRKPISRLEALEYQRTMAGVQFDAEILKCWIATMK
jgi:HD-GYP domain-containing protein (c-di-GMP phosphodiesterase class II)